MTRVLFSLRMRFFLRWFPIFPIKRSEAKENDNKFTSGNERKVNGTDKSKSIQNIGNISLPKSINFQPDWHWKHTLTHCLPYVIFLLAAAAAAASIRFAWFIRCVRRESIS